MRNKPKNSERCLVIDKRTKLGKEEATKAIKEAHEMLDKMKSFVLLGTTDEATIGKTRITHPADVFLLLQSMRKVYKRIKATLGQFADQLEEEDM